MVQSGWRTITTGQSHSLKWASVKLGIWDASIDENNWTQNLHAKADEDERLLLKKSNCSSEKMTTCRWAEGPGLTVLIDMPIKVICLVEDRQDFWRLLGAHKTFPCIKIYRGIFLPRKDDEPDPPILSEENHKGDVLTAWQLCGSRQMQTQD